MRITTKVRERLERGADRAVAPWTSAIARAGTAAKGLVYVAIGVLSVQYAIGERGAPASSTDAVRAIGHAGPGTALLWLVAAGLACYALWMAIAAVLDPERFGAGKRLAFAGSALVHGALAASSIRLALRAGGALRSERAWSAELLARPWGEAVLGAIGLCVLAAGAGQLWRAIRGRMPRELEVSRATGPARTFMDRLGRFGLGARGVVFALVGSFLVLAAVRSDARQTRGIGGVLSAIARESHGTILLVVVAVGLACYGLYMLCVAWFRNDPYGGATR